MAETQFQRLLEEKELLIKEIHHRVKNNLQVISTILFLKSQSISDPGSIEILLDTRQRLRSMSVIHDRLMQSESQITKLNTLDYFLELLDELKQINHTPHQGITYVTDIDNCNLSLDQLVNCGFIINEIVTSLLKQDWVGEENRNIKISFNVIDEGFELVISSDKIYLTDTISLDNEGSFGIQLVKVFVNQLNGRLNIQNDTEVYWRITFQNSN